MSEEKVIQHAGKAIHAIADKEKTWWQRIKEFLIHDTAFIFSVPAVLWQLIFLYIPLLIVIYISLQTATGAAWRQTACPPQRQW